MGKNRFSISSLIQYSYNLWDHGSCQNLGGHDQKHSKTHYSGCTYYHVKRLPFLHTEISSPRNWEGSKKFRRDKYKGLPKRADPKSRVSKAARPGVVKQSPSAVRVIKSIQEHLNVQGSGVVGIVVLWSQTLGSICLRVWVNERAREREREARLRRDATSKQVTLITSSLRWETDCECNTSSRKWVRRDNFFYYIQRHVWWLQTVLGLVTLNLPWKQ